jgi:hypothetical protein
MSWAQVETPPHLSNTYAAELREALTAADGFGSAVPAARIESASAQDTMTGALTARVYLSWVDLQLPPPTATTAETLNAISTASARVDARPTLLEVLAAADWTDGDHPPNLSAGLGEQLALADATDAALYAAGAVAENLVLLDHSACVGVLSGATVSEFAYATDESNGVHRAPDTFDAGPRHTFTLRRRPTQPGTITPPTPPLGG